jgi:hypothetical protein
VPGWTIATHFALQLLFSDFTMTIVVDQHQTQQLRTDPMGTQFYGVVVL